MTSRKTVKIKVNKPKTLINFALPFNFFKSLSRK